MLAVMGMLLIYGGLGGREGDFAAAMRGAMGKCPAIRRFSIHYLDHMVEERRAGMRALLDMLAKGQLKPRIGARLNLADAAKAHEMMEVERGDRKADPAALTNLALIRRPYRVAMFNTASVIAAASGVDPKACESAFDFGSVAALHCFIE